METRTIKALLSLVAFCATPGLSQTAAAEAVAAGNYKIDPAHTTIQFTVSHLGVSDLSGRFNLFEGGITLAPNGNSEVNVSIQTASVDTNHRKRDDHLRSPDFFNAKQYPEMRFVSKKVSNNAYGQPIKVQGDLTLHGKTRPVTLKVSPVGAGADPWGGYRAGFNATTTIKRSAHGMNFMQGGIGDDITITLNIEAVKQ